MEDTIFFDGRVNVSVGDIVQEDVDAIVNAANSTLLGGGGVDGAIHKAGGEMIYQECLAIREIQYPKGLPTGKAVITYAGNLKARFVIHTVGPIYGQDSRQTELLADSYRNSLELAKVNGLTSIAFPSISTGAFSYPRHEAAKIASEAIKDFVNTDKQIKRIRLIFFDVSDARKFIRHQVFTK